MADASPREELLGQSLLAATLELQALNDLVEEVPDLMELRFRREIAYHLALNQRLRQEQFELTSLVRSMNSVSSERMLGLKLPAFVENNSWFWQHNLLRKIFRTHLSRAWSRERPALRLINIAVCSVALCCLVMISFREKPNQSHIHSSKLVASANPESVTSEFAPKSSILSHSLSATSDSLVELRAADSTWVEVADLEGQPLLQDTMHAGDKRRIRLRTGLEVYAARPEQLSFRVDEGSWQSWPKNFLNTGLVLLIPSQQHLSSEGNR